MLARYLVAMQEADRQAIVQEAMSWLGTKFHHQGRIKKDAQHSGGCDCLGLIIGVAKKLHLKTKHGILIHTLDLSGYAQTGNNLVKDLSQHLNAKNKQDILPGDLGLFSFAGVPQHLAIIGSIIYAGKEEHTLIHAYSVVGYVCEHVLDDRWRRRLVSGYGLFCW